MYTSTVLIFMHRSDDDDFTTVCILKSRVDTITTS